MRELVRRTTVQRGFDPAGDFRCSRSVSSAGSTFRALPRRAASACGRGRCRPSPPASPPAGGDRRPGAQPPTPTSTGPIRWSTAWSTINEAIGPASPPTPVATPATRRRYVRPVSLRFAAPDRGHDRGDGAYPSRAWSPEHVGRADRRVPPALRGRSSAAAHQGSAYPIEVIGAAVHAVVAEGADRVGAPARTQLILARRSPPAATIGCRWRPRRRRVHDWAEPRPAGPGRSRMPAAIEWPHTTVVIHLQATGDQRGRRAPTSASRVDTLKRRRCSRRRRGDPQSPARSSRGGGDHPEAGVGVADRHRINHLNTVVTTADGAVVACEPLRAVLGGVDEPR